MVVTGATIILTVAASLPVVGIGDTEVTLNCDDGSTLNVSVDLQTALGLADVVQAMLDYPAGLSCGLLQTSVGSALLPGGIAAAADKKDFAVGALGVGTGLCFTGNISFESQSDSANSLLSTRGMIHESVQPQFPGCPVNGTFKADVRCLVDL